MDLKILGNSLYTYKDVYDIAVHCRTFDLSVEAWQRVKDARKIVDKIALGDTPVYGVNTGLGALCNVKIFAEQASEFSRHIILSHACGVGDNLRKEEVRAIMCAAVMNYSHGHSGISPNIVKLLIALLNHQITPIVPSQGSVGYLTQMAHIGLAIIGVGDVVFENEQINAQTALQRIGLKPCKLAAKDGLSLVNGVPCMTGLSALAIQQSKAILDWSDIVGSMSFEALRGKITDFSEEVLALKNSVGVKIVGQHFRTFLEDSNIHPSGNTQDAMSLRSIAQVHGACRDQWENSAEIVNNELNCSNDNPLIFGTIDDYRVVSQSNPHGEAVAMAADVLSIALCEVGGISERRIDRLLNPLVNGDLPPFLVAKAGLNTGLMISQYVAASLCADNKRLAQPAVLDNFVTSGLQEDHLSFGTSAALKLLKVAENVWNILAIEYLLSAQALDFYEKGQISSHSQQTVARLREKVAFWNEDRWLSPEIKNTLRVMQKESANDESARRCIG